MAPPCRSEPRTSKFIDLGQVGPAACGGAGPEPPPAIDQSNRVISVATGAISLVTITAMAASVFWRPKAPPQPEKQASIGLPLALDVTAGDPRCRNRSTANLMAAAAVAAAAEPPHAPSPSAPLPAATPNLSAPLSAAVLDAPSCASSGRSGDSSDSEGAAATAAAARLTRRDKISLHRCNIDGCRKRGSGVVSALTGVSPVEHHHCYRCQRLYCRRHTGHVSHEAGRFVKCPMNARCVCVLCLAQSVSLEGAPLPSAHAAGAHGQALSRG